MKPTHDPVGTVNAPPRAQRARGNRAALVSDLLPLGDALSVILATSLATLLHTAGPATPGLTWVVLAAALFASFILYDKGFGALALRAGTSDLVRSHAVRLLRLVAVLLALGVASQTLADLAPGWLVISMLMTALLSTLGRVAVVRYLRRLAGRGALREAVAVVGAGPVADRFVRTLHESQPHGVELLGIFDDGVAGSAPPAPLFPCGGRGRRRAAAHRPRWPEPHPGPWASSGKSAGQRSGGRAPPPRPWDRRRPRRPGRCARG